MKKGRAAVAKKAERLERLKIEYVPLGSLTPNDYNPNRQSDYDFQLLCMSIIEDGYTQPIVVQRKDDTIIDGEHRWTAMIVVETLAKTYSLTRVAKGEEVIPPEKFAEIRGKRLEFLKDVADAEMAIVKTDMTPEQMKIATLRHNRARGEEDIELTAQVLRDLQELGALDWAQDSLQMSDDEINRMIEDIDVPEALAGAEFNDAWEPEQKRAGAATESTEGQTDKSSSGGIITSAATKEAIEEQRDREKKIAEAKSEEEREKIREESKIHRINLVFSGQEAELIEEILGRYPAQKLVAMARVWRDKNLDAIIDSGGDSEVETRS
jgi:ParB-like chromosome segregation protein Spo0J